jgi:hypothetical protein
VVPTAFLALTTCRVAKRYTVLRSTLSAIKQAQGEYWQYCWGRSTEVRPSKFLIHTALICTYDSFCAS